MLINIVERSGHNASQPADPGGGVGVAHNDASASVLEAGKADVAHGVFLHAHDADIAKPAAGCASCRREQAKLGDSGIMAAAPEGSDDAEFKSSQFFFIPA